MGGVVRPPRDRDELRSHLWRDKVSPTVLARDGWHCHLCGQAIESYTDEHGKRRGRYKSPHPLSPSIDHVRGAGTGFDPRFLRAAHLGCNIKRGDPSRARDPQPVGRTRW